MLSTIVYVILFFEATCVINTMEWMYTKKMTLLLYLGQYFCCFCYFSNRVHKTETGGAENTTEPPRSDGSGIKGENNCTDKLSVKRTNKKMSCECYRIKRNGRPKY